MNAILVKTSRKSADIEWPNDIFLPNLVSNVKSINAVADVKFFIGTLLTNPYFEERLSKGLDGNLSNYVLTRYDITWCVDENVYLKNKDKICNHLPVWKSVTGSTIEDEYLKDTGTTYEIIHDELNFAKYFLQSVYVSENGIVTA